jgi:hypothetical protein
VGIVEVKDFDTSISSSLKYYADRLKPKRAVQIVDDLEQPFPTLKTIIF